VVGLWLIGGSSNTANTVPVGLAAMRRGLAELPGMMTELPFLAALTRATEAVP
jgi:hypothetical protein